MDLSKVGKCSHVLTEYRDTVYMFLDFDSNCFYFIT